MIRRSKPSIPPPVGDADGGQLRHTVAIAIGDAALKHEVEAALSRAGHLLVDARAIEEGDVVLVDAADDVTEAVRSIRARGRSDVAVIVLLRTATRDAVAEAHRAGAFACLRVPLSEDELTRVVAAAMGRGSSRVLAQSGRAPEIGATAIGRMSAALSHELGNPLAVLSMSLDIVASEVERLAHGEALLRELVDAGEGAREECHAAARQHLDDSPPPTEVFEALDDARGSAERMRTLLALMKELVGRPARTVAAVDLAAVLQEARKDADNELLRDVEIEEAIDARAWGLANESLLQQILVRLIANAAFAAKQLAAPRVRLHLYELGEEAIISVRDNGPGIDLDVQEKIFEPFYTTRRGHGGVGLGLALCREHAQQMGARITMWSMPGRGACFRVHIHRLASSQP